MFKEFKDIVENDKNVNIKCLRYEKRGYFWSNEFNDFSEAHGIRRQFSTSWTPQLNGIAERKNRIVQEMERIMLNESRLSNGYWREEISATFYFLNRGHITINGNQTPYELWKGIPANLKNFRVFGRKLFIKRDE